MEQRSRGFTVVELLIVVALIAVIAVFAIPSLHAGRISGNEASAISSLRTLHTVMEQYRARYGTYAGSLGDLATDGYVDNNLAVGQKSGYGFVNLSASNSAWSLQADPIVAGQTGERFFFTDESGVIRFSTSGSAGTGDRAID